MDRWHAFLRAFIFLADENSLITIIYFDKTINDWKIKDIFVNLSLNKKLKCAQSICLFAWTYVHIDRSQVALLLLCYWLDSIGWFSKLWGTLSLLWLVVIDWLICWCEDKGIKCRKKEWTYITRTKIISTRFQTKHENLYPRHKTNRIVQQIQKKKKSTYFFLEGKKNIHR